MAKSIKTFNQETEKWEVVASSDASLISIESPLLKAKDVNQAITEILQNFIALKQNVVWLYNNSSVRSSSFPYQLPITLAANPLTDSEFIEEDEIGRQKLLIENKKTEDEVSADEFNAIIDVINNNSELFLKIGSISVPDGFGGFDLIELNTAEDIIKFIREYGIGLPDQNLRPKIVFDKKTFVFSQNAKVQIPFRIVDAEGGKFSIKMNIINSKGFSQTVEFFKDESYYSNGEYADLHTGDNVISIGTEYISTSLAETYTLENITVYDSYFTSSEPVNIKVVVGTINVINFNVDQLLTLNTANRVSVDYTSVLQKIKANVRIQMTPLDGGSTTVEEEIHEIDLGDEFSTIKVNTFDIILNPTGNCEYDIKIFFIDSETDGQLIKTKTYNKKTTGLDNDSLYCMPFFTTTNYDRYEQMTFDLKILHHKTIQPNYDIKVYYDDEYRTTLSNITTTDLNNVSLSADTETTALKLTFEPNFNGDFEFNILKSNVVLSIAAPDYGTVSTSNLVLWLDARGRNSSESDETRTTWKNKIKLYSQYEAKIYNEIVGTSGWESPKTASDGTLLEYTGNCLHLNTGAYSTIPNLKPFEYFDSLSSGVTYEFCVHSSMASDVDTTLFSIGQLTDVNGEIKKEGMFLTPDNLEFYLGGLELKQPNSSDDFTYYKNGRRNENEEEFLHYSVVFNKTTDLANGGMLCIVYINGIICNAMVLPDPFSMRHLGFPVFNGYYDQNGEIKGSGDIKIRLFRYYNVALNSDTVLQNYIASMYNSVERSVAVESNRKWDDGEIPFISKYYMKGDDRNMTKEKPQLMSWTFYKGNEEALYTDATIAPTFIPTPIGKDGVTKFEDILAWTKWQGSSSLDYAVKNLEIDIANNGEVNPDTGNEFDKSMSFQMTTEFPFLKSYQLKTNYIDSSGANNIAMGKLINQIWEKPWSSQSLKTIQKYEEGDVQQQNPLFVNPSFTILSDTGATILNSRYPAYSQYKALNGYPFIMHKDFFDVNAQRVMNQFGGVMNFNLNQTEDLYGFLPSKSSSATVAKGPWMRNFLYKHDNNGQSTYPDELGGYLGQFDARAFRNYSKNGKTYEDVVYRDFENSGRRSIYECLGFELLMAMEQNVPENMGIGLRNGVDHEQWKYKDDITLDGLQVYQDSEDKEKNKWKYKWEFDPKYLNPKAGGGNEPSRDVNLGDPYTTNSIAVGNIKNFRIIDANGERLEWDKYAALAYHQNAEFINAVKWVATCTDEDFSDPSKFNRFFRLDNSIDYVVSAILFQLSDSLGRNFCVASWDEQTAKKENGVTVAYDSTDRHIFYPVYYDMDTSFGTDVYGKSVTPYLPFPHAFGLYKGLNTVDETLYKIEFDRQLNSADVLIEDELKAYEKIAGRDQYTLIEDAIYEYSYYNNSEFISLSDELSIPENCNNVKVLLYRMIGTTRTLVARKILDIKNRPAYYLETSNQYLLSGHDEEYFDIRVNIDKKVMDDQEISIKFGTFGKTIKSVESGTEDLITLNSEYVSFDNYYPAELKYDQNVVFKVKQNSEFNLYCEEDYLKIKLNFTDGTSHQYSVKFKIRNASEFSYNCVTNNFWRRLCKNYGPAIMARYDELRKGYTDVNNRPVEPVMSLPNIVNKYCTEMTSRIGERYYNNDAFLKYFGSKFDTSNVITSKRNFVSNARGNKFLYLKDFLKKRMPYVDSLMGYVDNSTQTEGAISIRHGYVGKFTLRLASVAPCFINIQWAQNQVSPLYLPGNNEFIEASYTYETNDSGMAWMKIMNGTQISYVEGLNNRDIGQFQANGLTALKKLDLSNNVFDQTDPVTIDACPNLQELYISNIPTLVTTLDISNFKQLKKVDFSNSQISIPPGVGFSNNRMLTMINLSGNIRNTQINLTGLTNLEDLKLQQNAVTLLNISDCNINLDLSDGTMWPSLNELYVYNNEAILNIGSINGFPAIEHLGVMDCYALQGVKNLFNLNGEPIPNIDSILNTTINVGSIPKKIYFLKGCTNLRDISGLFKNTDISRLPDKFAEECVLMNIDSLLEGCGNITSINQDYFNNLRNASSGNNLFKDSSLQSINVGLFQQFVNMECLNGCFENCGMELIIDDRLGDLLKLKSFNNGYAGNTINEFISDENDYPVFFNRCSQLSSLEGAFSRCVINCDIPNNFLNQVTSVKNICGIFGECEMNGNILNDFCSQLTSCNSQDFAIYTNNSTYSIGDRAFLNSLWPFQFSHMGVTSIGEDLGGNVTSAGIGRLFNGCGKLTSIGPGFLKNATSIFSYDNCFQGCGQLNKLPNGFLKSVRGINNFQISTMLGSSGIKEINYDFFESNTSLTTLSGFFDNSSIEIIPDGFLEHNNTIKTVGEWKNTNIKHIGNRFLKNNLLIRILNNMFKDSKIETIGNDCMSKLANSKEPVGHDEYGPIYEGSESISMFENSKIKTIGINFLRYSNDVTQMFKNCHDLQSIGSGFYSLETKSTFYNIIENCSLKTLPDGFMSSVKGVTDFNFKMLMNNGKMFRTEYRKDPITDGYLYMQEVKGYTYLLPYNAKDICIITPDQEYIFKPFVYSVPTSYYIYGGFYQEETNNLIMASYSRGHIIIINLDDPLNPRLVKLITINGISNLRSMDCVIWEGMLVLGNVEGNGLFYVNWEDVENCENGGSIDYYKLFENDKLTHWLQHGHVRIKKLKVFNNQLYTLPDRTNQYLSFHRIYKKGDDFIKVDLGKNLTPFYKSEILNQSIIFYKNFAYMFERSSDENLYYTYLNLGNGEIGYKECEFRCTPHKTEAACVIGNKAFISNTGWVTEINLDDFTEKFYEIRYHVYSQYRLTSNNGYLIVVPSAQNYDQYFQKIQLWGRDLEYFNPDFLKSSNDTITKLSGLFSETFIKGSNPDSNVDINFFNNCVNIEDLQNACKMSFLENIPLGMFNNASKVKNVNYIHQTNLNLRSIPHDYLSGLPNLESAYGAFSDCRNLILNNAENIFKDSIKLTSLGSVFNGCIKANLSITDGLFKNFHKVTNFESSFRRCLINGSISGGFLRNCYQLSNVSGMFSYSVGVINIEEGFLDNQHETITTFSIFFCYSKVDRIPDNLFNNYPNLTAVAQFMESGKFGDSAPPMFNNCPKLTNVFHVFRSVGSHTTDDGYFEMRGEMFNGCSNLQDIILFIREGWRVKGAAHYLFRNCPKINTYTERGLFSSCKLTSIPKDFYKELIGCDENGNGGNEYIKGRKSLSRLLYGSPITTLTDIHYYYQAENLDEAFRGSLITEIPDGYLDPFRETLRTMKYCFYGCQVEHVQDDFLNGFPLLENAENIFGFNKKLKTIGNRVFSNNPVLKSGGFFSSPNLGQNLVGSTTTDFQSIGDDCFMNCPELTQNMSFVNTGNDVYIGNNFGMNSKGVLAASAMHSDSTRFHIGHNFLRNGILDELTSSKGAHQTLSVVECGDNYMMDNQTKYLGNSGRTNNWSVCKKVGKNFLKGCSNLIRHAPSYDPHLHFASIEEIGEGFMEGCSSFADRVIFKDNGYIQRLPINFMQGCASIKSMDSMFYRCTMLSGGIPHDFLQENNITNFNNTFYNCTSYLDPLPEYWITHPSASHSNTYYNCRYAENYNQIPASWGGGLAGIMLDQNEYNSLIDRLNKLETLVNNGLNE